MFSTAAGSGRSEGAGSSSRHILEVKPFTRQGVRSTDTCNSPPGERPSGGLHDQPLGLPAAPRSTLVRAHRHVRSFKVFIQGVDGSGCSWCNVCGCSFRGFSTKAASHPTYNSKFEELSDCLGRWIRDTRLTVTS